MFVDKYIYFYFYLNYVFFYNYVFRAMSEIKDTFI